jgi:hypothetical protein
MVVSDVGKMAGLATITLGLFVLIMANKITFDDAAPFLTLILGYLVGNGVSAVRGRAPSSVIVPQLHEGEIATVTGTHTEGTA